MSLVWLVIWVWVWLGVQVWLGMKEKAVYWETEGEFRTLSLIQYKKQDIPGFLKLTAHIFDLHWYSKVFDIVDRAECDMIEDLIER